MGWTFGYRSRAQALREEFEGVQVVKQVDARGGVWVQFIGRHGQKAIAVALIEGHHGDFGIKVVDETMGPNQCDCPLSWLEEIPDPGAYATAWRERVRKFHASRVPELEHRAVIS